MNNHNPCHSNQTAQDVIKYMLKNFFLPDTLSPQNIFSIESGKLCTAPTGARMDNEYTLTERPNLLTTA